MLFAYTNTDSTMFATKMIIMRLAWHQCECVCAREMMINDIPRRRHHHRQRWRRPQRYDHLADDCCACVSVCDFGLFTLCAIYSQFLFKLFILLYNENKRLIDRYFFAHNVSISFDRLTNNLVWFFLCAWYFDLAVQNAQMLGVCVSISVG